MRSNVNIYHCTMVLGLGILWLTSLFSRARYNKCGWAKKSAFYAAFLRVLFAYGTLYTHVLRRTLLGEKFLRYDDT